MHLCLQAVVLTEITLTLKDMLQVIVVTRVGVMNLICINLG